MWLLHNLSKIAIDVVEMDKETPTKLVTDQTFGSSELFSRTSTVWFGPNDRTFFCRTQNFFSYQILCRWHPFILLFCFMTHMHCHWHLGKVAKRMPTEPK